jgi:hypothetical protein
MIGDLAALLWLVELLDLFAFDAGLDRQHHVRHGRRTSPIMRLENLAVNIVDHLLDAARRGSSAVGRLLLRASRLRGVGTAAGSLSSPKIFSISLIASSISFCIFAFCIFGHSGFTGRSRWLRSSSTCVGSAAIDFGDRRFLGRFLRRGRGVGGCDRDGAGEQDGFELRHMHGPSPVGHAAFFSLSAFAFNHFAICSLTSRPSRMPQTTRLAPRTMSPAAKTPGKLVIIVW